MTAINHAMTGAVIGLSIHQPLLALPLAFVSHFALDALPHFGMNIPEEKLFKSTGFRSYLMAEAFFCFILVLELHALRPDNWFLPALCAFLAASPDLFSINRYIRVRYGKEWLGGVYSRFASRIQWYEKPPGAIVEVVWALTMLGLMARLV